MNKCALLSIVGGILLGISSCRKDKVEQMHPVQEPTVSYATQIEPLIISNCSTSGCHGTPFSGGYQLLNYSDISANASDVLGVIRHENGTPMPIGSPKLADSLIQQFEFWINEGKMDN